MDQKRKSAGNAFENIVTATDVDFKSAWGFTLKLIKIGKIGAHWDYETATLQMMLALIWISYIYLVCTSDVMIPGVEPVPDYVFSHFLK